MLSLMTIMLAWALVLTGCNSKNVWDVDYDLTNEIWRQLHCYAQFQKENPAKNYWVEWNTDEFITWKMVYVDWLAYVEEKAYNLSCTYSDWGEWTIDFSPVSEAAQYCIDNEWIFSIKRSETAVWWECELPDGTVCEEWDYFEGKCPNDEVPSTYVKTELTNEDIDHIEEILPPLWFDYETWNMDDETMVESGHYDYPEDIESWYVFIPEHATMASREIKSSGIQDGMIYTDTNVTLQDGTVVSILYIHDPETLFVKAITVENGNHTKYYRNFLYNADVE